MSIIKTMPWLRYQSDNRPAQATFTEGKCLRPCMRLTITAQSAYAQNIALLLRLALILLISGCFYPGCAQKYQIYTEIHK